MRYRTQYIIKSLFFSFLLLSASVVIGQESSDGVVQKKVAAIEHPVQSLVQLEPGVFEYDRQQSKQLKLPQGKHYGFTIAEIEAVFPALIKQTTRTYMFGKNTYRTATIKTVDMESLIPVLVASVKQQQQEIEQLKKELQDLKKPVALSK
ncbi:tail fiber domain-containing protein [Paraflavitalea soli]|uniref:Tail fiber domain-containing protein n=1 Tax=Paraflavitalea soli TaxID=2315862 RepID=A0A3B7MLK8_9BACT|nr:tail fiber domain-containing protein [Paraflavitalea soli]AXY73846.1 tail fiber domain-containing protein [Paraflavitalea soli]